MLLPPGDQQIPAAVRKQIKGLYALAGRGVHLQIGTVGVVFVADLILLIDRFLDLVKHTPMQKELFFSTGNRLHFTVSSVFRPHASKRYSTVCFASIADRYRLLRKASIMMRRESLSNLWREDAVTNSP